jgi:2-polyprenyl-3-methyl-5-hydroxy-6-metoxy-1,4-benzoquinol methylase
MCDPLYPTSWCFKVSKKKDDSYMALDSVILEFSPCPLHKNGTDEIVVVASDRLQDLPGEFNIVRCRQCGLMRTSPRPSQNTIGFYYPADYGPYKSTIAAPDYSNDGWTSHFVRLGKVLFDAKATALPNLPKGRMLEIGCASGSFLHLMAQRGWDVEGIEFSPDASETARGLGYKVATGALETIDKPDDHFDLVVGWMVTEHLHDPIASLKKLARWTRKDGMLAISVPNAGSIEFRLFGERWYGLHLPNHLYHFDPKTIRSLLDASGWRVTRIQHHRTIANIVASLGFWLTDHGVTKIGRAFSNFPERGGRLGAMLLFPFAFVLALFGQTGRMTVWAQRKG